MLGWTLRKKLVCGVTGRRDRDCIALTSGRFARFNRRSLTVDAMASLPRFHPAVARRHPVAQCLNVFRYLNEWERFARAGFAMNAAG